MGGERKKHAYLTVYAFDKNGDFTDAKNIILTEDGKIIVENAIGSNQPENIHKEKPEYIEEKTETP